mmetsp:Transcript_8015/g.11363  ORF Transcript_8015/g.11363 Transcript_8015/m.11363 type:complete len:230 (-) Transcript_8015:258-947(-)|eukprot:CAMPEP_0184489118 /NCGR_PEP_ID=MMETSP0113_2-20130426/14464_1 /TAXON_ID=91329 /ORGANISM="Norrisiella sphaerica, Strain BC52" /LENGTH=229 /DNA_ID=CAMNT_0026872357 /DNA_START=205 /DNA_END=894 /DNA_ORIENTATION=+
MSSSEFSANDSQFVTPRSDRSDLFVTPRSGTQVSDVLSPSRLDAFVTPRGASEQGESAFPFTDVHPLGGVSSRMDKKDDDLQYIIGAKKWARSPKSPSNSKDVKDRMQDNVQKSLASMFQAARHCKKKEVEKFLKQGIKVDTEDAYGNTLFLTACQNGHKRIAKVALRQGANINHTNKKGCTGLHYCYAYGYKELAEYLKSKGADDTVKNHAGLTCYEGLAPKEDIKQS